MIKCKYCSKGFISMEGNLSCPECRKNKVHELKTQVDYKDMFEKQRKAFDIVLEERNKLMHNQKVLIGRTEQMKQLCIEGEAQYNAVKEEMLHYKLSLMHLSNEGNSQAEEALKKYDVEPKEEPKSGS